MKSRILILITVLLTAVNSFAQIKNSKTETVKIYGNCGMCKTSIEDAGNLKKIAKVDWNKDTKMAKISYDINKTNQDEILKRIALAGYDNTQFLAPDDAYAKLPGCCKYERDLKPVSAVKNPEMVMKNENSNHKHNEKDKDDMAASHNIQQLQSVYDNYFSLKDALVKTDAKTATAKAIILVAAIKAVDMSKLSNEEHDIWMKVMKDLNANAESISKSKNIVKQRESFSLLSKDMYELMKVSKLNSPVYYQNCPMYNDGKGANWLSMDKAIKNPYYGTKMMTCGSNLETIEK
ncbi:MAG: DUF3347 domain-containing protein [Bacteroidota bacterium]|nr:DUF3347 domain-containing protein [Bacteroidota bacterium]